MVYLQYKDAFFTAHPDFKWYKLPAPPLRPPSFGARIVQPEPTSSNMVENGLLYELDEPKTVELQDSGDKVTHHACNLELLINPDSELQAMPVAKKKEPQMGVFKLADEAQMGGLNSLMIDSYEMKANQSGTNDWRHPEETWLN